MLLLLLLLMLLLLPLQATAAGYRCTVRLWVWNTSDLRVLGWRHRFGPKASGNCALDGVGRPQVKAQGLEIYNLNQMNFGFARLHPPRRASMRAEQSKATRHHLRNARCVSSLGLWVCIGDFCDIAGLGTNGSRLRSQYNDNLKGC